MASKIAKKEHSYTHGQLFSRISAVMRFVAEGRCVPPATILCMFEGPSGREVLRWPAHRTPTRAHVSTATGRASPQYEFPTFSGHPSWPWGSPTSRSVEERALTREACVGESHGRPAEHYHIEEEIGEGTFGVVNLVRSRHGGHDRCMKTVLKQDAFDHGMAAVLVVNERLTCRVCYSRSRSGDDWTTRSKRCVEKHSYFDTSRALHKSLDDTTDASRRTHELALCDRCHTAWASGAHVWVRAGHPRYTRATYGEETVGGSFTRRQFTTKTKISASSLQNWHWSHKRGGPTPTTFLKTLV